MLCMVTFAINIPPMLAYIPYMDPMGYVLLYVVVADIPFYLSGRSHVIVVSCIFMYFLDSTMVGISTQSYTGYISEASAEMDNADM